MVNLNEISRNRVGRELHLPSRKYNLIHTLIASLEASRPLSTSRLKRRWRCRGLEILMFSHINT